MHFKKGSKRFHATKKKSESVLYYLKAFEGPQGVFSHSLHRFLLT